ncbi:Fic family protein [bacterium]|nr:Fic family protein [bacterium]
MSYRPPFEITAKAINLISEISEKIGIITALSDNPFHVELRKKNRIQTIHSSLAIEQNTLSIEQMTAIIEGKRVLGAPNEIQEVKNAVQAYNLLLELNPYEENDLLRAHKLMMADLVDRNGKYRSEGVGIFDGNEVVHVAPPAANVPFLMADLFSWLKNSSEHPLIKSCVFHYEFEFIHPFPDGNGRMGRFWQTVILKEWKPVFAWIPVETLVKEHQAEYYAALTSSDKDADSTSFIDFMLEIISKEIDKIIKNQNDEPINEPTNEPIKLVLDVVRKNPYLSKEMIAAEIGKSRATVTRALAKLQNDGIIRRIGSNKNGHWEIIK